MNYSDTGTISAAILVEVSNLNLNKEEVIIMKWETPEYNDIRFGFEVTMYINNK